MLWHILISQRSSAWDGSIGCNTSQIHSRLQNIQMMDLILCNVFLLHCCFICICVYICICICNCISTWFVSALNLYFHQKVYMYLSLYMNVYLYCYYVASSTSFQCVLIVHAIRQSVFSSYLRVLYLLYLCEYICYICIQYMLYLCVILVIFVLFVCNICYICDMFVCVDHPRHRAISILLIFAIAPTILALIIFNLWCETFQGQI